MRYRAVLRGWAFQPKSREAFLSLLHAGRTDYVINAVAPKDGATEAALDYMRGRCLTGSVIALLARHPVQAFADAPAWAAHLANLGINQLAVTPDPVCLDTEGAL